MAEKVVSVRLQARVEGFTAGMRKAKASVDELTKADVPKAARGYSDLANKAALAGAAIGVGLGVAVKRFAEFDKAMSAVRANTGATGDELESLRAAAIKLGADSQFSAKEAAEGVNELAKAGVKSADILGGGLKGSLDLAAAGQIGVAQAAETTATALTQFGLAGGEATHVADLLANGANKAQGGVGDLGQALGQAGLVAAATGLSIEETAAGLTAFASAGLIGSDAGTAFKAMLQRLSAPVGAAATTMTELGISAYDSQGNFKGLAEVADNLQVAFKGMTAEQRNAAMTTIFGSDAVRASNILYNEGADGIRRWTDEVNQQGAAAKQAATLTDNLSGDIERLGGAFDSVLIQTGSGANASLRTLVQGLQGLVETVGKVPGPILLAGAGLAAIALGVPKGIQSFRKYQATLDSVGLSFDKISAKGPRAAKAINAVTGAGKAFGTAMAVLAAAGAVDSIFGTDSSRPGAETLVKDFATAEDAVSAFSDRLATYSDQSSNWFSVDGVKSYGDALHFTFDPGLSDQIDGVVGSIGSFFGVTDKSRTASSAAAINDIDTALASMVTSGNADGAARTFKQFADAAADQGVSVDELRAKLPGYENALAGVDNAQSTAAGSSGSLTTAVDEAKQSAEDATAAWDALKDAIDGLGSPFAQQRAAERDFQSAIDDTAARLAKRKELLKDLADAEAEPAKTKEDRKRKAEEIARITDELAKYAKGFDVSTEAGRANQEALDAIREATLEKVKADIEAAGGVSNLEASTKAGTAAMNEGKEAFIKAATDAGMLRTKAEELATQLGLIPSEVPILVSQSGAAEASAAIDEAARKRTAIISVRYATEGLLPNGGRSLKGGILKADGGAIYGPGTGRSDSIPAWLSNGEHVLTAAEVAKMGGQSAVYALRAAIRQGTIPGYAKGGAVSPNYAPPVQYMQMAGGSSSRSQDNSITVEQVYTTAANARELERDLRQRARYNANRRAS